MRQSVRGIFPRKVFSTVDVAGFLQFVDLYAQVARRSSRLFPDENEVGLFDPEEDRHYRQAQFRVQQGIQFLEHLLCDW